MNSVIDPKIISVITGNLAMVVIAVREPERGERVLAGIIKGNPLGNFMDSMTICDVKVSAPEELRDQIEISPDLTKRWIVPSVDPSIHPSSSDPF